MSGSSIHQNLNGISYDIQKRFYERLLFFIRIMCTDKSCTIKLVTFIKEENAVHYPACNQAFLQSDNKACNHSLKKIQSLDHSKSP